MCQKILTYFNSIFFQRIKVINVTFCVTADKLDSEKNIESQEKSQEK